MSETEQDPVKAFSIIEKVTRKDMRKASFQLGDTEARYLVDMYYQIQDFRVSSGNQKFAASKSEEPHEAIQLVHEQFKRVEENIALALDLYTENHPIGLRIRSVKGIGPVISAGFLANLKIELDNGKPINSAGQWWRYCGLDPTIQWYSQKKIEQMINEECTKHNSNVDAFLSLCEKLNVKPLKVLYDAKIIDYIYEPEEALKICHRIRNDDKVGLSMFHADNIFKELIPEQRNQVFTELLDGDNIDWPVVRKKLAMKPWNAALKRLCWLLGESFVKVKSRDGAIYGKLYMQYRDMYQKRNENLEFKENCEQRLKENGPKLEESLRKLLKSGKLPDKALHEMAKRKTVQMFLSHMHAVWYEDYFGEKSPQPYAHAILGHKDYMPPAF